MKREIDSEVIVISTEQKLEPEDRRLIDEVYARLRVWKNGAKELHDRARVARKILLLNDPHQDAPGTPANQRMLQLQTLKSTFNNCVADQMDNVMEAVMTPETPDMQGVADDVNDIVRYILYANDYQALHRERVEDYLGVGTAITQIMWDDAANDGEGEVKLLRVPLESFLWDPAEADIQNSRALFKVTWHPISWYRAHYPDVGRYVQPDEASDTAVGENENQEKHQADEPKAMMLEYWYRTYDPEKKKYRIDCAYIAGGALLEKNERAYAHGMYPFVVDVFTRIEGLPVGNGLVMELAPMMRYINRYAHYMDVNIRKSAKTRMLVNRAANVNKEALEDWNSDVIDADRVDAAAINFLQTPPLTGFATSQMLQMQTDLKQDSGQNQFTRGETAGGVTAASAIASLQEAGGKQTRMRTEALKRGFKAITEQILWLISEFYDEKRKRMITGKDESYREIDMSPSRIMGRRGKAIPKPPYAVRINIQRMNPATVGAQNQLFIDAYKMSAEAGNVFPLSVLFRILNIDGKDQILPIIDAVEQQTVQMQALAQENEQLNQVVQEQQKSIQAMKQSLMERATQSVALSSQDAMRAAAQ